MNTEIRKQLDEYVAEYTKDSGKPPSGPLKPPSWEKHDVANLFQELSAHIKELEDENERLSKILTD